MSHGIANLVLLYFKLLEYWYRTMGYGVMCFIMWGFGIKEVKTVQGGKVPALEEPQLFWYQEREQFRHQKQFQYQEAELFRYQESDR